MKEVYLGTEQDQQYIRTYLKNIRQLDPIEIATLPNPINLSSPFIEEVVDIEWFWTVVIRCLEKCEERYSIHIDPLRPERYYIAQPPKADVIGGFNSPHSLGYQYWYHAVFVVILNQQLVSKKLRTVELARNFLHDCFHHSTLRSFRRAIRLPAVSLEAAKHRVPEVYREQYGINFRNQDRLSYSSPDLTAQSPETINLNILMDGVIVSVVAELMREVVGSAAQGANTLENEIRKEIFLEPFAASILPRAYNFYKTVILPSKLFIEYWGDKGFITLVLQTMVSGELLAIKRFFEECTGVRNAWEKKFKRPEFQLLLNPQA